MKVMVAEEYFLFEMKESTPSRIMSTRESSSEIVEVEGSIVWRGEDEPRSSADGTSSDETRAL